ncbi:hypothetical protein CYMTET_54606 [Cymbomonas tetramitiformis]|uniref:Uncharacterized protein n=1 Tax=Cymbomonas tetramitiformis TaxID=36881 RepID=A0AAE0BFZ3_9CHLO|nr:hypothetical protein CYMTET_54606 [Cymbomonas tetramitiformis]
MNSDEGSNRANEGLVYNVNIVNGVNSSAVARQAGAQRWQGAVVIEYFDGNPVRDEVFLEGEPRSLGEHDGHLIGRDGGGEVTVAEVDGWSAEAERDLLVGWRLRDQAGLGSAGMENEADGAGEGEAGGPIGPLGGTLGGVGGLVRPEGGGRQVRGGQQAGTVVCSVPGCTVRALRSRRALTEHFRRIHPDASGLLLSAAGLTRCPAQSCRLILSEIGLRQHCARGGGCQDVHAQRGAPAQAGGGEGGRGGQRAMGQARRQPMAGGLARDPEGLGEAGWAWLRGLSIDECAVSDYPSLMVPKRMRGLFTECAMVALRRMRVDTEDVDAYKLFFLLPRLILQPVQKGEKKGVAQVIKERCTRFLRRDWEELHAEAPGDRRATAEADEERVLRDAVRLVKAGQLGKAAKRLELSKLAPATDETLQKLERLHPAGTGRRREVEEDRRRELQAQALELDEGVFDGVMRHLPQASGPGSSQWRWEHLWAIHVSGGRDALLEVCNHLAAGRYANGWRVLG